MASTIGSNGLTRYSRPLTSLPSPAAITTPIRSPIAAVRIPSRSISRRTLPAVAPSAIRMPISRVRRHTSYAFSPEMPIVASRSASTLNVVNIRTSDLLQTSDLRADSERNGGDRLVPHDRQLAAGIGHVREIQGELLDGDRQRAER